VNHNEDKEGGGQKGNKVMGAKIRDTKLLVRIYPLFETRIWKKNENSYQNKG
jgi:hypothetical protein